MVNPNDSSSAAQTPKSAATARAPWRRWIPILRLRSQQRGRVEKLLLGMNEHDRYLRFGFPASDDCIRRYVATLDFDGDEVFGIFNRQLELVAIAHLAYMQDQGVGTVRRMAEFAVSVHHGSRGRGYGNRMFAHAVRRARNRGVDRLFIHALSENTAMLRIARNAGAVVQREGSESEAWLQLPPDTWLSRWEERLSYQLASLNYLLKRQTLPISRMLGLWRRSQQH